VRHISLLSYKLGRKARDFSGVVSIRRATTARPVPIAIYSARGNNFTRHAPAGGEKTNTGEVRRC